MGSGTAILLIDHDWRRRAAIAHCLSSAGIHVEPSESVDEAIAHWPRAGLILANDADGNIAALMQHMGGTNNGLPVVAFAEAPTPSMVVQAVLDGALDYVAWPFAEGEPAAAIAAARVRASNFGEARLRAAAARTRIERLTPRERQVLSYVAKGLSSRVIGETLEISPRTVEIHRANLLNRLGVHHTSEAIRIAIEAALIA